VLKELLVFLPAALFRIRLGGKVMGIGKVRRLGILTGGGDCPGLNAVIRAVVKTAIRDYSLAVVGFENGFGGLLQNRARNLSENDVVGILPRGGTILGTTNRDNPFHYPTVVNGEKVFNQQPLTT
jgi:6-phosphofructokinase 1